ncbi:uncharacterized protein LOC122055222 [Zingiber officinale]|uniref:uncharacterized protein LOC122055222 n=1 Tax=Zingiber officinale TaxID=94328 RepID=UPI001C4AE216|nr:uncharacterized protein LOC122055222 [Zingiber officinale]
MWGNILGVRVQPTDINADDYAKSLNIWETDNAKIITWINNSVSHSIDTQLTKYETTKEVWDHLARLYTQSNFAKQYQLEANIRALQQQDMGIQDFYSAMSKLWDQLALTKSSELRAFLAYVTRREEQRLVQFLMALRDDFEGLRGTILHRSPLPSVDSVVHELLAEEIRLKSQVDKKTIASSTPSVFATPQRYMSHNQSRSTSKVSIDECAYCKEKGYWKSQCPLLLNKGKQPQQQKRSPQQQYQQQRSQQPPLQHQNASWKSSNQPQSSNAPSAMSASSHISLSSSSASVMTDDGTPMPLLGVGSVVTTCLCFPNVYFIPSLTLNLVSDPQSQKVIGIGRRQEGLYVLDKLQVPDVAASSIDLLSF